MKKTFQSLGILVGPVLFVTLGSLFQAQASQDLRASHLLQRKIYGFNPTSDRICAGSQDRSVPIEEVRRGVADYEREDPGLAAGAVRLLTFHLNPELQKEGARAAAACARSAPREIDHCVLKEYWGGNEETALRVLALFYDAQVVIQRSNSDGRSLSLDQIRQVERVVERLPTELLRRMSLGHPYKKGSLFENDNNLVNGWAPLNIVPGSNSDQNTGSVIVGTNLITFNPKALDLAQSGQKYKDLGVEFVADFRAHLIAHEVGHVADSFWLDNTGSEGSIGWKRLSNHPDWKPVIQESEQAIWPHHWWDAFEGFPGISGGRYSANEAEKFAEFFAQYLLLPQALQASAPRIYDLFRTQVFQGAEFRGYEQCRELVRPLNAWDRWTSPTLRSQLGR